jgi:hypothetical protein
MLVTKSARLKTNYTFMHLQQRYVYFFFAQITAVQVYNNYRVKLHFNDEDKQERFSGNWKVTLTRGNAYQA